MPFIQKSYEIKESIKASLFLQNHLKYSDKQAQKMLSRLRIVQNEQIIKAGQSLKIGQVQIIEFVPISKGLKPIFINDDFVIFDKPSLLLVHPNGRHSDYTLLDEVKYQFGKYANPIHRLDYETSGLVVCSRNKWSEAELKIQFEDRNITKKYFAIVTGDIAKDNLQKEILIDTPIKNAKSDIRVLMKTALLEDGGKPSLTKVIPIKYDKAKDLTLLEIELFTGRQHQIRVHLHSIGYPLLGEPLYGHNYEFCDSYLRKTLSAKKRVEGTGANRVMLHSDYIEFEYKNRVYKIKSKQNFNLEMVKLIK